MLSSKTESGISNVECHAFPPFSINKELLRGKSCHVVEPYDDGQLVSVFVLKDKEGSIIKVLDQTGIHIDPMDVGELNKDLMTTLNIGIYLRIKQSQLFFSIKGEEVTLVDVFDGKNFISPGMLSDIYGKRLKIQNTKSIEKYDPNKKYNAIIKPIIICPDNNNNPIYIKDQ